jgi:hypothetical protein
MRFQRNLSLSTHGTIELAAGMAMLFAPAVFGFGPAGIVVSFALGSLLIGAALTLTTRRGPILSWHRDFDSLSLLATAVAALALALAGEGAAGIFLAALVAIQFGLHAGTRYTSAA